MPAESVPEPPDNAKLSARAARDLRGIRKKNRPEFLRLWEDLVRLAARSLPATQSKKLAGMGELWELDSGRYRVVYYWRAATLFVVTVFPKADQRKVFRHI